MRNLIKKILRESNELDWIINTQPTFGEVFKAATENDPRIVVYLSDDGEIEQIDDEAGYHYWHFDRKLESPEDLLDLAESNIEDWGHKDKNYDDWIHFRGVVIKTFFPNINESYEWDWVQNEDINPWLEYNTINFDIVPFEEDVAKYIELALSTREINNPITWQYNREGDIESIIEYSHRGNCYLNISKRGDLSYGDGSFYNNATKIINYSTLIGKPLNESEDDLDWIRDSQPRISFEEAKVGDTYNIEKDEILLDALLACDDDTFIYDNSVKAKVIKKTYGPYDSFYCESENSDEVIALRLKFFRNDGWVIGSFWVTEDMVTLYPILEDINESEENPFQWIEDIPTGIELKPNTLYYFEPSLTFYEMSILANNIINSPTIKVWLSRRLENRRDGGMKYFVTRNEVNESIRGWCTETDLGYAKLLYPGVTVVNGRKEFGL